MNHIISSTDRLITGSRIIAETPESVWMLTSLVMTIGLRQMIN
jgi:hypothetical protein